MAFEKVSQTAGTESLTDLVVADAEGMVLLELTVAGRVDGIAVSAYSDDRGLIGRSSRRIERTERS